jgi:fucose 4-O-acetylase-like acetyltransferase
MTQTKKEKPRLIFLDAAKGIGILSVMFGHITEIGNPIDRWVGTFKLPIFFLITGYLISRGGGVKISFRKFLERKCCSLLIPYFSFSALIIIYKMMVSFFKGKDFIYQMTHLADDLYTTISLRGLRALWFLTAMFIAEIIFFFVMKFHVSLKGLCVLVAVLIFYKTDYVMGILEGICGNYYEIIRMPILAITKGITGFLFLGAGYILYILMQRIPNKNVHLMLGILLLIINISAYPINQGVVDFNNMRFGGYPFLYMLCALCGSSGWILVLEYLADHYTFPILTWCGRNSLIIMSTHGGLGFQEILVKGWEGAVSLSTKVCLKYYIESLMILFHLLILEYGVVEFVNKKMPFLIGKFGNRTQEN